MRLFAFIVVVLASAEAAQGQPLDPSFDLQAPPLPDAAAGLEPGLGLEPGPGLEPGLEPLPAPEPGVKSDDVGYAWFVDPYSASAFDASQFTAAPLFGLRLVAADLLLPRPANPKDILRRDPEDTLDYGRGVGGLGFPSKAVAQLQGTSLALAVEYAGNVDMAYDTGFTGKITYTPVDIAIDGTQAARRRGQFLMSARTSTIAFDLQSPEGLPQSVFGLTAAPGSTLQ